MSRSLRILGWLGVSLLGVIAVGVMAFERDEPINALWLVIAGVCSFAVAYRFYSAWLMAKVLTIDETRAPAAVTKADGKDFVPTPKWVVFGHHFAAIAGPGPLVGQAPAPPTLEPWCPDLARLAPLLPLQRGRWLSPPGPWPD